MGLPCLFTRQQVLKLGYYYWLHVKNSNHFHTELSLGFLKHIKFYLENKASFIQISMQYFFIYAAFGCRGFHGDIALFRTVPWLAWSPRLGPNTPSTELFSQKNHVLLSNCFSCSNMLIIRLFLANTWKKKSGVTVLVSSQTAVKGGHGFDIVVRLENLRGRDWHEIQTSIHRFRNTHLRLSLFSVVFMCLISPTHKFILGKS